MAVRVQACPLSTEQSLGCLGGAHLTSEERRGYALFRQLHMVSELVTQITLLKHESQSEILSSVLLLLYQRLGVEGDSQAAGFT